jgi:hypothetical protein
MSNRRWAPPKILCMGRHRGVPLHGEFQQSEWLSLRWHVHLTKASLYAMRGGMWSGRASRRTQRSLTLQKSKASAGIGTTAEHPPRKPETRSNKRPHPPFDRRYQRAGAEACPYTENVVNGNGDLSSIAQSQPLRDAWWNEEWACLKAYPKEPYATKKQSVRGHRHDRGTSTAQALT